LPHWGVAKLVPGSLVEVTHQRSPALPSLPELGGAWPPGCLLLQVRQSVAARKAGLPKWKMGRGKRN